MSSKTKHPTLLSKERERVFRECCRDEKANNEVASASAVCIVKCTGRMERKRGAEGGGGGQSLVLKSCRMNDPQNDE